MAKTEREKAALGDLVDMVLSGNKATILIALEWFPRLTWALLTEPEVVIRLVGGGRNATKIERELRTGVKEDVGGAEEKAEAGPAKAVVPAPSTATEDKTAPVRQAATIKPVPTATMTPVPVTPVVAKGEEEEEAFDAELETLLGEDDAEEKAKVAALLADEDEED